MATKIDRIFARGKPRTAIRSPLAFDAVRQERQQSRPFRTIGVRWQHNARSSNPRHRRAGSDSRVDAYLRYETHRRVIDVSGDGDNNSGRDVTAARDEAIAKGVTVNGLVILTEAPLSRNPLHTNPLGGLANYYRNNVIGGPGAFVMVAESSNTFGDVIIKKLIAEIAQAVPHQRAGN